VHLTQDSGLKIREAGQGHFHRVAPQLALSLLLFYLAIGRIPASAQTGNSAGLVATIIVRMAQARAEGRARLRPYIVTRSYKLFGKDAAKSKAEVIANIAFVPPSSKKYSIQETNGSGVGIILVRRMLVGEAEVEKEHFATDLSTANYDFRFVRQEDVIGQRIYVLELLPRRNDQYLLRGKVWVDADTYRPLRFEGEFAKSPSWWVRDVRLTFVYGDVGGMWLQTSTEAAADVRILGRSTMVSRDMKYDIPELVAASSSAPANILELMLDGPFRYGLSPPSPK